MYRGSTPTLCFTLPISTEGIVACYVTIAQRKRVIINHDISKCTMEEKKIKTKLSQTETLLLNDDEMCEVQLRVKFSDGTSFPSQIFTITGDRILMEGEI